MLLRLLELFQLDRKLLLLLAASLMPACIIPVGPDWQDPPGEENLPPQIVSTEPAFIGPEYLGSNGMAKFTVRVRDRNGDALFFKWFANFSQPFTGLTRVLNAEMDTLPPVDDREAIRPVEETFDCAALNDGLVLHRILVVVADKRILSGNGGAIEVEGRGEMDSVTWTLNLPCQSPQSP